MAVYGAEPCPVGVIGQLRYSGAPPEAGSVGRGDDGAYPRFVDTGVVYAASASLAV